MAKIIIDTDQLDPMLRCLLCGRIIWPEDRKLITGFSRGNKQRFTSMHWACWNKKQ